MKVAILPILLLGGCSAVTAGRCPDLATLSTKGGAAPAAPTGCAFDSPAGITFDCANGRVGFLLNEID